MSLPVVLSRVAAIESQLAQLSGSQGGAPATAPARQETAATGTPAPATTTTYTATPAASPGGSTSFAEALEQAGTGATAPPATTSTAPAPTPAPAPIAPATAESEQAGDAQTAGQQATGAPSAGTAATEPQAIAAAPAPANPLTMCSTGYAYPLGSRGDLMGLPYQGTHTLFDNWESDNAVDLGVAKGTPVYAVVDGVIGDQIGPLSSSDPKLAGERLHLVTADNEYYYAHLSQIVVRAGDQVKKGQLIGYSGTANGVDHLHFAAKVGSPLDAIC